MPFNVCQKLQLGLFGLPVAKLDNSLFGCGFGNAGNISKFKSFQLSMPFISISGQDDSKTRFNKRKPSR